MPVYAMRHLFTFSSCFCFTGVQVDIVSLMDLRFLTSLEKDADESGGDATPDGDSQSDEHPCIGNISSSILWQALKYVVLSS